MKILMSGMIAAVPYQGGATWAVLQYLLGLRDLGHEVQFVETITPEKLAPAGVNFADSLNAKYFRHVVRTFKLERQATLLNPETKECLGSSYEDLLAFAQTSDVLLNLSGCLKTAELIEPVPLRVYLDIDPGFTQLWHEVQGLDVGYLGHNRFASIGLSIGRGDCPVPSGGIDWIPTLQPIVLEHWPVVRQITREALTTVANWRGYGSVEFAGRFYGQKAHSLRPIFDVPLMTDEKFTLALTIHPDEKTDLEQLRRFGWQLIDPASVASTPEEFRQFVQGSKAEFGFAKSGYVEANCGWFSDRSICYLASGRPVIAQETGFSDYLPKGEGLFAYKTREDLLDSISTLNSDYAYHCAAARRLAENHFDSRVILTSLLQNIGARQ